MDFVEAYEKVKPCIVAIVPKFSTSRRDFPEIIGTGFLISKEGVVCTCKHVADEIQNMPKPPGYSGYPALVLLFRELSVGDKKGWGLLAIDIQGIGDATVIGNTSGYLGPNPPDISFLLLPVRDTPYLTFSDLPLSEGEILAFAGFPMGTRLLKAPGWMHQFSPSLHWGIASAILPHRLEKIPHAFLIHSNTQGGASGSPVFRPDGTVVGMVYMGVDEEYAFGGNPGDRGVTIYSVPTSLTGCVPREVIEAVFRFAESQAATYTARPTFQEYLDSRQTIPLEYGKPVLDSWDDSQQSSSK
jgi:hypothetical protein